MENKLRVVVFTQNDIFFIPQNIIAASKVCNIIEVVDNKDKSSLDNKILDMITWFGFFQCAKMGLRLFLRKIEGFLDLLTSYKMFGGKCNIKHAANLIGANYLVVPNINAVSFVNHVRKLQPDLIISYSAPQIVKTELLNIPRFGIINVHGALLPNYRGCMPSFWYLYNGEKIGGATVHLMSSDIDDGDICLQESIDISDCDSMFKLIKKTKLLGGKLIVEAIKQFSLGTIETRHNNTSEGSYFSWPTKEHAKIFRDNGLKFN